MLLGCIGDDFTGSSDLANTLAKGGMATTQYCGVPDEPAGENVEAGVVALKTRSTPAAEAVAQSLAALDWLKAQGCRQFLFKYCSTFDSTPDGNIGPVADALIEALGASQVVVCPAFPATGRTLYQGHLFVGDRLLSESGMEHHPLTPMTDPDIRRWLALQSKNRVGHVGHAHVRAGAEAIRAALASADAMGSKLIVVDAITEADLQAIGNAVADLPLITGGSGIALGLPENFRKAGQIAGRVSGWQGGAGPAAILSGSCSRATRQQVEYHRRDHPSLEVSADALMTGKADVQGTVAWVMERADQMPIVYSSADPETVKAAQEKYGAADLAGRIEEFFARTAPALVEAGIRRLVSAGGETSGAVVGGLGCSALEVGPEIDPGVPMLRVTGSDLVLALKSGNFGSEDFFEKAIHMMAETAT
ncbi:MAG TPA: 3-oxo-tetronate kinase [Rhizobiaceae bacterium]|nr:3-oxo-tetronate kinase [Rhizobiaceae bacterium]